VVERFGDVTWEGTLQTAVGRKLEVGEPAPNFELVGPSLEQVRSASFAGQAFLLSTVPSLDTPVCDVETRRWNESALSSGARVRVLTVSMDLPFALERWRDANGISQPLASAHMSEEFGTSYGVLIKEKRLLARAVFVIGTDGVIRFAEYVREVDDHPSYSAALSAIAAVT
jgi:thioredoxin-dependent peroxiredoxin